MAEIIVNLDNVTVTLAGRVIFAGLSWEVQAGQRVGLVGPNGAGKSTLLKLIAQELPADKGEIFRQSGLTWGRLAQEPDLPAGRSVWQEARTALPELLQVEEELARLEGQMGEPAVFTDPVALKRVMAAHERQLAAYERLEGARYEARLREALARLGFGPETWDTPVEHLSGGQKKLIMLAKLAVRQPRLLLLDEPDNHLDIAAKRALESFINSYGGCVIIISHDRYLLDEVATHIAELENGRLTLYEGNYTAYMTEREIRRLRQQQLYAAQQKEIARIEAAIARFEYWASIVVNERHIRQARARQKMLDRMDKIEKVTEARRMALDLAGGRGSNKVIELIDAGKRFENSEFLWQGLNQIIWHNERVGLVGPNGAGKSMLLKQLLDPEGVSSGQIRLGPSSRIGYYAQEHETLDYNQTPLDLIRQAAPLSQEAAVAFLGRFLFTYDQVRGRIGELSGGERSRLQLARLVLSRPNLLLLDEPTNNLDIASIEVLEEALDEFVGTVVIISHDRYFLDRVVDRVLELRDGRLREFVGGYTDYLVAANGHHTNGFGK
ncbi:MAG: ATP-binding cassette domain-containing protein [Chloroflexi bacterium]|nr:ATP-binding cassette domain-containing protein [Chloroflexota bacterium]MCI0581216.1 ATP-binding cassette domain-containing protein [Chloroflexota bacterium]MCI0644075.1 ATP-binding cassette domain-containing protein [Chloroflexota bacterium]MCI0727891.1 ATP-binding cassette domain-containing protein [Chloroflexota bacterium]